MVQTATERTLKLGGLLVPYPEPTSPSASRIGVANRRTDTACERRLRSALHLLGLRFRKDFRIALPNRSVRVDVAFTKQLIVVFVDGCYWHSCPLHGTIPKSNTAYWEPKLARNRERDRANDSALAAAGWRVVRIWEHEDPAEAAVAVAVLVRSSA